jgi:hypothetical protein
MSGAEILNVVQALIDESDIEKICVEYWRQPKKEDEDNIGGCLIKVNVEKEWV